MINEFNEGFDEEFCVGVDVSEHNKTFNFDGVSSTIEPTLIAFLH